MSAAGGSGVPHPYRCISRPNRCNFLKLFFGGGAGNVANVEVLPVPMSPVANAGQGRRDGAGFYHGPGEMTRKMCGNRGQCDILAGAWRGAPPRARRGAEAASSLRRGVGIFLHPFQEILRPLVAAFGRAEEPLARRFGVLLHAVFARPVELREPALRPGVALFGAGGRVRKVVESVRPQRDPSPRFRREREELRRVGRGVRRPAEPGEQRVDFARGDRGVERRAPGVRGGAEGGGGFAGGIDERPPLRGEQALEGPSPTASPRRRSPTAARSRPRRRAPSGRRTRPTRPRSACGGASRPRALPRRAPAPRGRAAPPARRGPVRRRAARTVPRAPAPRGSPAARRRARGPRPPSRPPAAVARRPASRARRRGRSAPPRSPSAPSIRSVRAPFSGPGPRSRFRLL